MLYLAAVILSFFLSFVLLTKKYKSTGDYVLVAWLAFIGFHLLSFYLFFTGNYADHPVLFVLSFPMPLVHGPLLFLYTIYQTTSATFKKKQLLHFVPVVLSLLLFVNYFMMPAHQQIDVLRQKGKGFELQMMINLYAGWLSGVLYVSLSLYRLIIYKRKIADQFSNVEKINFNWLLYLIIWIVVIWVMVIFSRRDVLIFGAASIFVLWIGYFGIKQVQVFSQRSPINTDIAQENENKKVESPVEPAEQPKYLKSSLTLEEVTAIHQKLNALMDKEQPYKNPDLTLTELAKQLNVHPNTLSRVINSQENKNFYDLINQKRVLEFIRLSSQPLNQQYTLLSLAYDCGFNSKASFNRNFKKHTGHTPSVYVQQKAAISQVSSTL
jgi:AraC-like DNA-binding protein